MKKNQKGFTIVELVLSFALISVIVIGMLTIVINYRSMVKLSNRKIELVQYKSTLTKAIQDDIIEYGVSDVGYCTNSVTCVTFTFKDGTTKNLSFSNSDVKNRYIQYGNQKFPIQEAGQDDFTSLSDAMIHLPSERTGITFSSVDASDRTIFKIRIPITADDIDEDFGLFIVASDGVDVLVEDSPSGGIGSVSDVLFTNDNLGENCTTYDDGVDTFLVGQCSNNYVWYSGKLWRVVLKNNATGTVKMVTDNAITVIPYNASGNPTFNNSYMDQWLNQEFLPTLHDYEDYLVTDYVWDATLNGGSVPVRTKGTTTVQRTVGLLNAYEYYTTYNNSNGLATLSTGYLTNEVHWWLLTPASTSSVRRVTYGGSSDGDAPSEGRGARPSVILKSTIQIDSGSGSKSNPYVLKGDMQETIAGTTLLSTRYSGEYITFNNELYRIVNVENGLTKITAADKPSALISNKFHSSSVVTSFAKASVKTDLENYYQSLTTDNPTAYNMIEPNTTWYLGTVGEGKNYKASICATADANTSTLNCTKTNKTTTASISLPRVGEMFTSQITRGTKSGFLTLTLYDTSNVRFVHIYGILNNSTLTRGYGARPSMYLKSTVKIASNNTGNGTYEKPYSLSLN